MDNSELERKQLGPTAAAWAGREEELTRQWRTVAARHHQLTVEIALTRLERVEAAVREALPAVPFQRLAVFDVKPADNLDELPDYLARLAREIEILQVIRDEAQGRVLLVGKRKAPDETQAGE
ncbi:MAG: hypothetical protein LBK60_01410 [Verrucomicrobiales bacterium]|nr:hypothetical protein [Verrucomicrobiales bacterium]